MSFGVFDHFVDLGVRKTAGCLDSYLLLLARGLVLGRNVQDPVGIDIERDFYLGNAATLAAEVGYVALPAEIQKLTDERRSAMQTGSMFEERGDIPLLERMRNKTD